MPQAALAPIIGVTGALAGGAGSAMGGKKGNDAAKEQLGLQKSVLNLGKDLTATGMNTAWKPAANYWSTLLSGNPTAVQEAIGPISEQMRTQSQAGINNLASSMPAGGERSLAVAQAQNQQYGNLARLYAGVQPQAAQALGQLSTIPMQTGAGIMGQGAPQVGAGLYAQQMAQNSAAQGMAGAGNLLYQSVNKARNGKNSGGGSGSGYGAVGITG
jgi:hypothetical protein